MFDCNPVPLKKVMEGRKDRTFYYRHSSKVNDGLFSFINDEKKKNSLETAATRWQGTNKIKR